MRRFTFVTTVAVGAALVMPGAAMAYEDLRSPDARDAAAAAAEQSYQDLRSPDARDAGSAALGQGYQDLRSPDARDAGREPSQLPVPEPVVEIREPGNGFDWGDAAIGAAGILALLSIAAGVTLIAVGRRRRRGAEAPAH